MRNQGGVNISDKSPIFQAMSSHDSSSGMSHSSVPTQAVGYVTNTYPRPSQTFIRREIQAVERQGLFVARFAMRREEGMLTSEDLAEQERTEYILDHSAWRLATVLGRRLLRHPRALTAAVRAGLRGGPGRGVLRQLIYLAEGAILAERADDLGLGHIHAHFGTNSADVARYARLLGGPGYSVTFHGPEEFDRPQALMVGEKLADARFAIAVSTFGRSQLARWTQAATWKRLHVVHCGVDPAMFADGPPPPARAAADKPLQIIAIGRFVEQKGYILLLEALAATTRSVHLTLVGEGPLAPAMRETIRMLNLEERVTFAGWLDEGQVRARLADAHVFVMPSFAEGLPVALIEAMMSARPAIATYIAGIPELMIDGQTGWLVPAGCASALARAMDKAADCSDEALARMGQDARARASARHDIDESAARLARLMRPWTRGGY